MTSLAAVNEIDWRVRWEADLESAEHELLTEMLARAYPAHASLFTGGHSWSGARPEFRVVGYSGAQPVAHLGVLRRYLRLPTLDDDILVADVGLVAVAPSEQKRGLGRQLLVHTAEILAELGTSYGFLTCRAEVVPFYETGGWQLINGQRTSMIDNANAVEIYEGPTMVLPVQSAIEAWPRTLVQRNGLEV